MKPRQFVDYVLHVVKREYPELYLKHITGRRAEFINENAPLGIGISERGEGKRIGYLGKNLRLLWAIEAMFQKSLPQPFPTKYSTGTVEVCEMIDQLVRGSLFLLCKVAFWEFVRNRFNRYAAEKTLAGKVKWSYALGRDWSVYLVPRSESDQSQTGVDDLMGLIGAQAIVNHAARALKYKAARTAIRP